MEYFRFGFRLALGFLIAGTGILVLFYLNPSSRVALTAYQFTLVAVVVNWIYVLYLLFNLLRQKISISILLRTLGVMAINIPIGILYSYIMVWLLGYARITFINQTGENIPMLNVQGCEQKEVANFENSASETVWIKIKDSCNVEIIYDLNGGKKNEQVLNAIKNGEGLRITYELK
jgi:hypothetical protein